MFRESNTTRGKIAADAANETWKKAVEKYSFEYLAHFNTHMENVRLHQQRMKSIKSNLNYIKETEWIYYDAED